MTVVGSVDHEVFVRRFLAQAVVERADARDTDADALTAMADEALEFGSVRKPNEILVRVDRDRASVDVVTDDVAYLVDSVRAELARTGHPTSQVLHPQLVVSRDADGRIIRIHDLDDTADVPEGAVVESWMHVRFGTDGDPAALEADLRRVLVDVLHAAADQELMLQSIAALAEELRTDPGEFDRDASAEAGDLLEWLAGGNCLVLGHASYSANELANPLARRDDKDAEGVLRGNTSISPLELLPAFRSGAPLVVFKSPLVSTVKRQDRYDCITVVTPAGPGKTQMVHVFLGLIASEDSTSIRVPVVRRRIAEIMTRSGVRADSHTGRRLLAALRTLPRDELLEAPTGDLLRLAALVVDRADRGSVGVFARIHLNRDFVSVLVYFPSRRFGPFARSQIEQIISRYWPGDVIGRDDKIVEMDLARMHFLIEVPRGTSPQNPERSLVEADVTEALLDWTDHLGEALRSCCDAATAARVAGRFAAGLPEAFKEDVEPEAAAADLLVLDGLPESGGLAFDIYTPTEQESGGAQRRLKVYRTGQPVSLVKALPVFTQLGIDVIDERPYELELPSGAAWIYDFGLSFPNGLRYDDAREANVVETIRLLWQQDIELDGFNALVVSTPLTWWQVNILRAYAKYLRQAGTTYSQGYIERALKEHSEIAVLLVRLFEARFNPAYHLGSDESFDPEVGGVDVVGIAAEIEAALSNVASLDQDSILRSLLGLVRATLRTNAYRTSGGTPSSEGVAAGGSEGVRRKALAFKLDPHAIRDLPEPRPKFEIWVYSPRVEGVHLRFGAVARGGLRWSDRAEDFRTEILGLVKAQMVKNAVIVPTGAKGGFVAKQLPDAPPAADRDAWLAEGVACYRTFISCLLDVTDNMGPSGNVIPPPQVRRHDGDDPYLVVAADKGTATFSDIANEISAEYGFWLGDAFASGGSVGYDHKAMGITARGAWESVRYHFRERGVDVQTQPFTVVGIGDMSGDVFGNGMLLSEQIRLVAAFDHRHIFIDPTPDAAASYTERRRLFELPRSSWADYSRSVISAGGGVFPRTAKAIKLNEPIRQALGIAGDVQTMTPHELIRRILLAPVDLLWNGGIGTYVKAAGEPNTAVGDKANDAVRVNGGQLRAKVVGEGGNLGFTQLGRVEFARAGGAINTDAIDNSAGVDTSDHEVNLKILLDRQVAARAITRDERNELLASVTDEVADLVLRDNYEQNVLLGMARMLDSSMASVHQRFMQSLEASGDLDRELEFLPSDKELDAREANGQGLVSPENAVLLAYSKITLMRQIEASSLPNEPWYRGVLAGYFPKSIAERFADALPAHPLAKQIITTVVVNDMINYSGTTFVHRAMEETGAAAVEITKAYSVVREVFDLPSLWAAIEALDNVVPAAAQHAAYAEIRRLIDRATRWFLDVRFPLADVAAEIQRFAPTLRELGPRISTLVRGIELDDIGDQAARLSGLGLPEVPARRVAELLSAFLLLDVVEIANASEHSAAEIAELHFTLSDLFWVDEMLSAITDLPRDDRWSTLARAAVRHDVYAALSAITHAVLRSTPDHISADERVQIWTRDNHERVERARSTVRAALDRDDIDLATLSVALRVMRGLPS